MHRRRIVGLAAALLAATFALTGFTGSGAGAASRPSKASHSSASLSGRAKKSGILTFAEQPGSPPTYIFPLYDGANSGNDNITYLQPLMWLPLYWFGHSNSEQATINYGLSMADPPSFSKNGKTVTMKLKHYVWSDGKAVTARDLVFWMNLMEREKNEEAAYVPGGWMDHVAGYSAKGADTFVLRLSVDYNPTYLLYNGLSLLTPIPQHAWDKTSAKGKIGNYDVSVKGAESVYNFLNKESLSLSTWDTNPLWQVVDGPYRLKAKTGFQVTGQVIMVANKKFSGPDKPKVSEFEELPFTSPVAEFDALKSGTVDYGYVPTTDIANISSLKSSGFKVKPWYEWGLTFIGINFVNPKYFPLENQLYIRQALQETIDQPAYIKDILQNYGTPTYGPVPTFPTSDFLSPKEKTNPYPYSLKKAKALLKAHGWKIPSSGPAVCEKKGTGSHDCGAGIRKGMKLSIPLIYPSGFPAIDDEIQEMKSAASEAGIGLPLSEAPENTVLADAYLCIGKTLKTCPASSTALSIIASPVYTYVPIYYPDGDSLFGCDGATNGGMYCNRSVEALIKKIITTVSNRGSLKAMYSYQVLVAKQLPDLWFPNSAYQISAISPKLGGVSSQDSTAHIYPQDWYLKK